jgi:hypothetical protein
LDYFAESYTNEALFNFGESTILDLIKQLPIETAQLFNTYVVNEFALKEIT